MRILNGSLSPREAADAEDHLDQCFACLSLLVEIVKVVPSCDSPTQECTALLDE